MCLISTTGILSSFQAPCFYPESMANRIDKPCYTDLYKDLLAPERKIKKSRKEISKDQRVRAKAYVAELKNTIRSLQLKVNEQNRTIARLNDLLRERPAPNLGNKKLSLMTAANNDLSNTRFFEYGKSGHGQQTTTTTTT